jgi:hypothetical protein
LADALHLGKAGEGQPNRLAHAQVGIHFDFVVAYFYIANGYCSAPASILPAKGSGDDHRIHVSATK